MRALTRIHCRAAGRLRADGGKTKTLVELTLKAFGSEMKPPPIDLRLLGMGVLIPLVVVIAPLGEEMYFRGRLFEAAERSRGRRFALIFTTVLFATLHLGMGAIRLPQYLFISLLFGAARVRTGALIAPILAHAINNLAAVLLE